MTVRCLCLTTVRDPMPALTGTCRHTAVCYAQMTKKHDGNACCCISRQTIKGALTRTLGKQVCQGLVELLRSRRPQLDGNRREDDVELMADDVLHLGAQLRQVSIQLPQQHPLTSIAHDLQLSPELLGLLAHYSVR